MLTASLDIVSFSLGMLSVSGHVELKLRVAVLSCAEANGDFFQRCSFSASSWGISSTWSRAHHEPVLKGTSGTAQSRRVTNLAWYPYFGDTSSPSDGVTQMETNRVLLPVESFVA
jgi:hypothetical protein